MKNKSRISVTLFFLATLYFAGSAQNPIIQSKFTADPAPMVCHDTVFLYTGHDEDDATGFKMLNWLLYTSTDMVNWTDHGIVASLKDFNWAPANGAWALQCIERNGKFYLYCPVHTKGIGVLVSESPYGPFSDPLGKPLISHSTDDIDPTVYIDDDGQAYLYWGNPDCYYVKLNEDMISYSGEIVKIDSKPANYQEGPWFYKRNGHYYLAYASTCCPEGIGYAMSNSPTGPWVYKGMIMAPNQKSSGNHPGIIDYKGNSYVFGFNYAINFSLTNVHRERRSVCLEKMTYNPDGTIQELPWWTENGVPQIGTLNPYLRTEAATMAWESGIETEKESNNRVYVTDVDNGDFIKVKGVNFGDKGAGVFSAGVASASDGGVIELHIDSVKGPTIGTLMVSNTGGWFNRTTKYTSVNGASGIHDLFLVFKGSSGEKLFNIDDWKFQEKKNKKDLVAINASVQKYQIDTVSAMNTVPLTVEAIYADGTSKNVSKTVTISLNQKGIVKADNALIKGINYGSGSLTVDYNGKTDTLYILVKSYKDEHTVKRILSENNDLTLYKESKRNITATAEFADGHTLNITDKAHYQSSDPQILTVSNGTIEAGSKGEAIINISYTDEFGNTVSSPVHVTVTLRNPYLLNKAVDYNEQSGVQDELCSDSDGGKDIGMINDGDWIRFGSVDFSKGASAFEARVASATQGGNIEIHLDSPGGKLLGSLVVKGTSGWQTWVTESCPVGNISGVHDLYFKFTGNKGFLLNYNWWRFMAE